MFIVIEHSSESGLALDSPDLRRKVDGNRILLVGCQALDAAAADCSDPFPFFVPLSLRESGQWNTHAEPEGA